MGVWIFPLFLSYLFPSIHAVCNPFLIPISIALQRKQTSYVFWGALLTGVVRDIILASPTLGICTLSSLLGTSVGLKISRTVTLEGWLGLLLLSSILCLCDHLGSAAMAAFSIGNSFLYKAFLSLPVALLFTSALSSLYMATAVLTPKIRLYWLRKAHDTDT